MKPVLTAEQMRQVDKLTTERFMISQELLMENAAAAATRFIVQKLGGSAKGASILVLCGKGNNGGDGAAVARQLWQLGANVEVCLFGLVEDTKGSARANFEAVRAIAANEEFAPEEPDIAFEEIAGAEEWLEFEGLNFHVDDPDVIVDALFGTGLTRPLDGVYLEAAAFISAYAAEDEEDGTLVVALDLPSGLSADSGRSIAGAACAHATVTFTAAKSANVVPPASNACGELCIANIGSPFALIASSGAQTFLVERCDAQRWLDATEFTPSSYKKTRGHLLIAAGSENYAGAAVLVSSSAMRSGVGLVTLACPENALGLIRPMLPAEVICAKLPSGEAGVGDSAAASLSGELEKADCVAIGCGLPNGAGTRNFVERLIGRRTTPIILDAEALRALSPLSLTGTDEHLLILTPHLGEFKALLGREISEADDVVQTLREFAQHHKVIVVLKGERTLTADPDGNVYVNPTGNSGLGKAGNGDTLTGVIAGFVTQAAAMNTNVVEAVVAAVYISGLAGDLAMQKFGRRDMNASDVRDSLADAFLSFDD